MLKSIPKYLYLILSIIATSISMYYFKFDPIIDIPPIVITVLIALLITKIDKFIEAKNYNPSKTFLVKVASYLVLGLFIYLINKLVLPLCPPGTKLIPPFVIGAMFIIFTIHAIDDWAGWREQTKLKP